MAIEMKMAHPSLGQLIRRLRQQNRWTLKDLSKHSGIPVSTLSKVEHDQMSLTYDKLFLLSKGLGIRMSELFADADVDRPSINARRSIGRFNQAMHISTPNYDYHYVCTDLRRKRMIPLVMRIKTKTLEEFGPYSRHPGEEYNYVLHGRVAAHTEFYETVILEEGDSIYIDASMGHAFLAAEGCDEAVVVEVCSSDEEDLMSSLMHAHGPGEVAPTANEGRGRMKVVRRP